MPDVNEISSTTQKFLDIFDITNDVLVLKDGSVAVIMVISAMNFGLLAEQEQDAVIYAYAALLNSLNFPVQIVISSRTKDATAYLRLLDEQAEKASTREKADLIKRYQTFVGQLIRERNVLDKKFYVIVPASPAEVEMITPSSVLPGNTEPALTREQKSAVIEKGLGILEPRRDHMISQFNRIGLYARQLHTQEIIEIFYNSYNPEAFEGQQITDSKDYTTMVVQAKTAQNLNAMQTLTTDNNSNQEKLDSLADVPPAGIADISASAVVPKELPEAPPMATLNNSTLSTPVTTPATVTPTETVATPVTQPAELPTQPAMETTILPKPGLQTVFQATQNQVATPPVNQPLTPLMNKVEIKIDKNQTTEQPLPPVAEL